MPFLYWDEPFRSLAVIAAMLFILAITVALPIWFGLAGIALVNKFCPVPKIQPIKKGPIKHTEGEAWDTKLVVAIIITIVIFLIFMLLQIITAGMTILF